MSYPRIDKHSVERIEGSCNMKALENFKKSFKQIADDMIKEGFDVLDVHDYLVQTIEEYLIELDDE